MYVCTHMYVRKYIYVFMHIMYLLTKSYIASEQIKGQRRTLIGVVVCVINVRKEEDDKMTCVDWPACVSVSAPVSKSISTRLGFTKPSL